ncbi:hypothetical protein PsYK624_093400 [Phanerochaete sordida]|uniref:Uncharacterized protein n=1 Tax=Phanerochaete sordida TaxID=48140 RepID=A0A9P3GE92_9APHY|nr:hypothetical protein PsYK624_093400 [Phanerochaete sordida]
MLSTMVRYHSGRSLSTLHVQISVTVPTSPHSRQSPPISVEGDFGISCPMTMPMDSVRNDFPLTETLRSSFLAIEATDGANLGLPIRRGRSMGPMRAPNLSFFTRRSSRLIFCIHARQTARYSFRSIMHRPRGREEQTVQHPRDVTPSAHGL